MATLTKKDLLEAIEDMPENLEVWTLTNALCYEVNRVELRTLWVGKEKKTVILLHGKHVPLC
jgi:hypothetical protein